jgi:hypothetical protein
VGSSGEILAAARWAWRDVINIFEPWSAHTVFFVVPDTQAAQGTTRVGYIGVEANLGPIVQSIYWSRRITMKFHNTEFQVNHRGSARNVLFLVVLTIAPNEPESITLPNFCPPRPQVRQQESPIIPQHSNPKPDGDSALPSVLSFSNTSRIFMRLCWVEGLPIRISFRSIRKLRNHGTLQCHLFPRCKRTSHEFLRIRNENEQGRLLPDMTQPLKGVPSRTSSCSARLIISEANQTKHQPPVSEIFFQIFSSIPSNKYMIMPAIQASKQAASSITAALKNGNGAVLARDVAERCFLPAFSHATAMIPLPKSANFAAVPKNDHSKGRRNFSSVPTHEHDKIRLQGRFVNNGDLVDYWKSHQNEHINLNKSELVDYWKDHMNTHMDSNALCKNAMQRNFSTNQRRRNSPAPASKFNGDVIDYWSKHNDAHFTDYWDEQPNTHL